MAYINGQFISNPYRDGTKMREVFRVFSDGLTHTVDEVVLRIRKDGGPVTPAHRRTAASFIRTLREKFTVELKHGIWGDTRGYRLTGVRRYYDTH